MSIFIDKTWLLNYFFIKISLVFQLSHKFGFFIYSAFHLILPIKSGELDFRILHGGMLKGEEPILDEIMLIIYSI